LGDHLAGLALAAVNHVKRTGVDFKAAVIDIGPFLYRIGKAVEIQGDRNSASLVQEDAVLHSHIRQQLPGIAVGSGLDGSFQGSVTGVTNLGHSLNHGVNDVALFVGGAGSSVLRRTEIISGAFRVAVGRIVIYKGTARDIEFRTFVVLEI